MSHGLYRAYLLAMIAQRNHRVSSLAEGPGMKLVFVGGPIDGDERQESRKGPRDAFVIESQVLKGPNERPMRAKYSLQNIDFPTSTATYRFAGWNEAA
jgi:hypothetical protein